MALSGLFPLSASDLPKRRGGPTVALVQQVCASRRGAAADMKPRFLPRVGREQAIARERGSSVMRKYLLAAVAATAIATPAVARDNSGYVGVEGGIMFPRNQDVTGAIDFNAT